MTHEEKAGGQVAAKFAAQKQNKSKILSDVISLLTVSNEKKSFRKVAPKVVTDQIKLLVEAMISNKTMLDEPATKPKCVEWSSSTKKKLSV